MHRPNDLSERGFNIADKRLQCLVITLVIAGIKRKYNKNKLGYKWHIRRS